MQTQTAKVLYTGQRTNANNQFAGRQNTAPFIQKKIRCTHCFSCKTTLNSRDFDVCPDCGWIVCDCGACGCRFE